MKPKRSDRMDFDDVAGPSQSVSAVSFLKRLVPYMTLIVVASAALPYLSGLTGDFVFDDMELIRDDPFYVQEANPLRCWTRSYWRAEQTQGMYRPLTLFSYWVNARFFATTSKGGEPGLWSPGFRATNMILHILVALLLFRLARALRFGRLTAFLAATLYAVHPIHVEAVTPSFGRGELLCALFLLAALLLHLKSGDSIPRRLAAAVCFLLSFFSKEHGVVFLPMALLMDSYMAGFRVRRLDFGAISGYALKFAPYLAAVALVFCMRRYFLGTWLPAQQFFDRSIDNVIALSPPLIRIATAVKLQGMALLQFAWPAVLSHDYSYAEILPVESLFDPGVWGTLIVFIGVPAVFAKLFPRERRGTLLLVLLYLVSVIPAGNFIVPAGTIYAERLQYIPSMWLVVFAALAFTRFSRRLSFRTALLVFIAAVFALAVRTVVRTFDWRSVETLAYAGVQTAPKSLKMWSNYAVVLADKGDWRDSLEACGKALSIRRDYATGHAIRGLCFAKLGRLAEAERELREALRLNNRHPGAAYNLGILYMRANRPDLAVPLWRNALKYNPNYKPLKRVLRTYGEREKTRNGMVPVKDNPRRLLHS